MTIDKVKVIIFVVRREGGEKGYQKHKQTI
jgi:hypothetical protein